MSGLAVAYWQTVFDKTLLSMEKRLHKKLDQAENQQLMQKIEHKDKVIDILLDSYSKTLKIQIK